jgi:hypothetical protein
MNDHESSAAVTQELDDAQTERTLGDGLRDEKEFSGAAASELIDPPPKSQPEQTIAAPQKGDDSAAIPVTGFAPFRLWVNTRIRQRTRPPVMSYGGELYSVTELTPEGQLRLEIDERAVNVGFDERFIPKFLEQIL